MNSTACGFLQLSFDSKKNKENKNDKNIDADSFVSSINNQ